MISLILNKHKKKKNKHIPVLTQKSFCFGILLIKIFTNFKQHRKNKQTNKYRRANSRSLTVFKFCFYDTLVRVDTSAWPVSHQWLAFPWCLTKFRQWQDRVAVKTYILPTQIRYRLADILKSKAPYTDYYNCLGCDGSNSRTTVSDPDRSVWNTFITETACRLPVNMRLSFVRCSPAEAPSLQFAFTSWANDN